MRSHHLKKAVYITLAVVGFFTLTVLLATPYLIDLGIERWIGSRGPEIAQVGNIDFNPFTGSMVMENLVVETKSGRTVNIAHANLKFSWKQLFKKQLYLKEMLIRDVFMLVDHLDKRGLRVGGLILRELAGSGEKSTTPGWEVGVEQFMLRNAQIKYDTPELQATYFIDQYTLAGLETWNKQKPVKMAFRGRINESPVQVDAEIMPFGAVKAWKGSLDLREGDLELLSKARGFQEFTPSGSVDLDLELAAKIQEDGAINIDAAGSVVLNNMQLLYKQYGLQQERLAWQGRTAVRQQEAALWLEMSAEINGAQLVITDKKNDTALVDLAGFAVTGIEIAGVDDIQFAQAELHDLRLVETRYEALQQEKKVKGPLLQTAQITISGLNLQNRNDTSIGEIKMQDLAALIHRDKEGSWQFAVAVPGIAADVGELPSGEKVAGKQAKQPIQFELGSLQVRGNSSISFKDESLSRPFQTVFYIEKLDLGIIKTAGAQEPERFKLKGRVGDYGSVAFEGSVNPVEHPPVIDTTGTIGSLDMVPFSSYTGQTIGYNVTSGQLDADITMKVDKGIMDGKFDLRMRNLEVAQVDPEKMPEVDKQMNVPLGSALAMLRNKKDEINLKLELKGDMQSPEFGIQDAINQALAKAMQFATLSYLKYTLQPFGTYIAIAEVVGKAGKEMSKVGLDPVIFTAGEIVLDDTANQYLEKIRDLLNNRPKLRIELCGRAVQKDREALVGKRLAVMQKEAEKSGRKLDAAAVAKVTVADDVLFDFAEERAKLVKETLVKHHAINHERIYLCLPEVEKDPAKAPMVELFLD